MQGLIDFMVLANSGAFVGFGPSTYSFFLSEYRTLQSGATNRSVLVDGSAIGTGQQKPYVRDVHVCEDFIKNDFQDGAVGTGPHSFPIQGLLDLIQLDVNPCFIDWGLTNIQTLQCLSDEVRNAICSRALIQ